jgi:hypothetical protein
MDKLKYLLPISAFLLISPLVFPDQLVNYITLPIFYFFGMFFLLINFRQVGEFLYRKPIYLEDLVVEQRMIRLQNPSIFTGVYNDNTLQLTYGVVMNFILAFLFALFSEYIVVKDVRQLPIIEIFGIIGGNLSLYFRIQSIVGKIIIKIFHIFKKKLEKDRENLKEQSSIETVMTDDNIELTIIASENDTKDSDSEQNSTALMVKKDSLNSKFAIISSRMVSSSPGIQKDMSNCVQRNSHVTELSPEPFKNIACDKSLSPILRI